MTLIKCQTCGKTFDSALKEFEHCPLCDGLAGDEIVAPIVPRADHTPKEFIGTIEYRNAAEGALEQRGIDGIFWVLRTSLAFFAVACIGAYCARMGYAGEPMLLSCLVAWLAIATLITAIVMYLRRFHQVGARREHLMVLILILLCVAMYVFFSALLAGAYCSFT